MFSVSKNQLMFYQVSQKESLVDQQ